MENEFLKQRQTTGTPSRMAAALDLLIDYLLEEYGNNSTVLKANKEETKGKRSTFANNGNHKFL